MSNKLCVYLASPLGFTESGNLFMREKLIPLISQYYEILNPWDINPVEDLLEAINMKYGEDRNLRLKHESTMIGLSNKNLITKANFVIAVLDGMEADSGTASEVGYAAALGKTVFGYRGDYRSAGDNDSLSVNLQLQYFVECNGGRMCHSLTDLENALQKYLVKA